MSWFHASKTAVGDRNQASAAEIAVCFRDHTQLLESLAFFITADHTTADQAVAQAGETTLHSNSPFRDWLFEWAKAATIKAAISRQDEAIRMCEGMYKDRRCPHVEHLCHLDAERRAASLALVLQMDAQKISAELDPLCRAIVVLRIATRSSIQECSLRLSVSRAVVLAANCLAMTWLDYHCMKPLEDDQIFERPAPGLEA
jgi:hypothetical protein